MSLNRRQIVRACKTRGWTLQPAVLEGLEEYLQDEEALDDLLNVVGSRLNGKRTITVEVWESIRDDNNDNSRPIRSHWLTNMQVVNAFATPKLTYEVMRKQFLIQEKRESLFGSAEDKVSGENSLLRQLSSSYPTIATVFFVAHSFFNTS